MLPLQSSNISILKEVKFTKLQSLFLILVYTKGLFFTMHTLLINFISITDGSRKQPRPILQDQDQDCRISVSNSLNTKTAVSRITRLCRIVVMAKQIGVKKRNKQTCILHALILYKIDSMACTCTKWLSQIRH